MKGDGSIVFKCPLCPIVLKATANHAGPRAGTVSLRVAIRKALYQHLTWQHNSLGAREKSLTLDGVTDGPESILHPALTL